METDSIRVLPGGAGTPSTRYVAERVPSGVGDDRVVSPPRIHHLRSVFIREIGGLSVSVPRRRPCPTTGLAVRPAPTPRVVCYNWRMTTVPPRCEVEYTLLFRIFKFLEPGRYLQVKMSEGENGAWKLKADDVREWIDYEGRRTGISPRERADLLLRLVRESRRLGLWLQIPGVEETPRPANAAPTPQARTVKALLADSDDEASPADGEDIAIVQEDREAAKRASAGALEARDSGVAGETSDLSDDPELRAFLEFEEISKRVPKAPLVVSDPASLMHEIETALAQVQPMAQAGLPVAHSIERQLLWCRGALRGEKVEAAPGPLTLGDLAVREFDMHGNDPALAALLVRIQDAVQRAG